MEGINDDIAYQMKVAAIARVCHQANKAWCETSGDFSQQDWNDAAAWQINSAVAGVAFKLANPDAGKDAQHNAWMTDKIKDGWVYGPVKDAEAKTHPCIVPFDQLPEFQQKKDELFCAIVDALK
jgi:RyR domain